MAGRVGRGSRINSARLRGASHKRMRRVLFSSPPFILGLGAVLVAEALFWFVGATPNASAGALAAASLAIIATVSLVFEIWPADNPLRWFIPFAPSQNVI